MRHNAASRRVVAAATTAAMLNPLRWLGATNMFIGMLLKLAMVGKNKASPANVRLRPPYWNPAPSEKR